jgi:hypothetical protein
MKSSDIRIGSGAPKADFVFPSAVHQQAIFVQDDDAGPRRDGLSLKQHDLRRKVK